MYKEDAFHDIIDHKGVILRNKRPRKFYIYVRYTAPIKFSRFGVWIKLINKSDFTKNQPTILKFLFYYFFIYHHWILPRVDTQNVCSERSDNFMEQSFTFNIIRIESRSLPSVSFGMQSWIRNLAQIYFFIRVALVHQLFYEFNTREIPMLC